MMGSGRLMGRAPATLVVLVGVLGFSVAPALAGTGHGLTGSFGSEGSTAGLFKEPSGVAVNQSSKDVYVVDKGNNRVEWFDSAGSFEGQFNGSGLLVNEQGKTAPEPLSAPEGIAVDNALASPSVGDVYVVDDAQAAIDKFSATGEYLFQLKGFASAVIGVAVDPSGDVWVAEESGSVSEFDNLLENKPVTSLTPAFGRQPGIAVDSEENLYLVRGTGSVAKFNKEGNTLEEETSCACSTGLAIDQATNDLYVDQGSSVAEYGPFGKPFSAPVQIFGSGQLAGGVGIAVDGANGSVYVADSANDHVDIFTLGERPSEAPLTEAAKGIAATSATLHGELNPGGKSGKLEYQFDYNTGGTCTGGSSVPVPAAEVAEGKQAAVEAGAVGLRPSTQYTYCLVAINAFGPTQGSEVSFTTGGLAPTVDGQSESNVTPFDATLEGQVNANNQETTYHLEYATDSAFTENVKTLAYGISGPGVYGDQPVGPVDLGGTLTPSTTYYYRVVARNATGEVKGTVEHPFSEFTTLSAEAPSIEGETLISAGAGTTDTIEAQLNPHFEGVSCEVQYVSRETYEATGFTTGVSVAACAPQPPGTENFTLGGTPDPFTATLSELQENTAYEYRIIASNATGTTESTPALLSRTAPQLTGPASVSEITQHTAQVNPSTIVPEVETPLTASYYIIYGTATAHEQATAHTSAGSGLGPNTAAPVALYGLAPGTTYHYAVVAYNGNATTTGPEAMFKTVPAEPPTPPLVGTQSAQFVNENSAVIEAEINSGGAETTYAVQYGTSTAYGSSTPGPTTLAPSTSAQGTITALTGLSPGTTYHYRIVASNGAGTGYGPDATFTTTGAPRTAAFTSFTVPTVPLIAATPAVFPAEGPVAAGTTPKALTRAQKLAKALKACRKQAKSKRAGCKAKAGKEYGPVKRKRK
jgi:hypothetical protein